jgi:hypothetical protein
LPVTASRELWLRYEPIHDLIYFSPRRTEQADALGLRGFWMGYFAFRSAPLGAVPPEVVGAMFFGFHRSRVRRALPDAWSYTTVAEALAARDAAADAAVADLGPLDGLTEATELAWQAASAADVAGRPLAAAHRAQPRSDNPRIALWQATSILREHRGDGHIAALLVAGLDPVESLVSFAAIGAASVERFESRGWSATEWESARERLTARGLLDETGGATDAGRDLRHRVEHHTDQLAATPWQLLGTADTARLADLLGDFWVAVLSSGLLPSETTLGIGKV